MDKVSIVIAGLNCSKTLAYTLLSCAQSDVEGVCNELIFVDDGSQDSSVAIFNATIKELQANGSTVNYRLYSLGKNMGVSYARNFAISRSSNEFIAIIDADDLMPTGRLKWQLSLLLANKSISVVSGSVISAYYSRLTYNYLVSDFIERKDLVTNPICNPGVMMRKSHFIEVGGYNTENLVMTEDLELWYRFITLGYKIKVCSDVCCIYTERHAPRRFKTYLSTYIIHLKNNNFSVKLLLYFAKDMLVVLRLYRPKGWS